MRVTEAARLVPSAKNPRFENSSCSPITEPRTPGRATRNSFASEALICIVAVCVEEGQP